MLKENLLLIAKTSSKLVLKFILILVPALLVNWLFIFVLVLINFSGSSSNHGHELIPILLIITTFMIGFPFVFFNIARDSAIKKGLNILVNKNKVVLIQYIINKLTENLKLKVLDNSTVQNVLLKSQNFISLLGKIPYPLSWVVNYFLKKIPFAEFLTDYLKSYSIDETGLESASLAIANNINERFDLNIFNEKKKLLYGLWVVNILAMIVSASYLN